MHLIPPILTSGALFRVTQKLGCVQCVFKVFYPPLFKLYSIAYILTPLTGGPPLCEVGHAPDALRASVGGLKGEKAPGDAHPYLVLFCLFKITASMNYVLAP